MDIVPEIGRFLGIVIGMFYARQHQPLKPIDPLE